MDQPKGTPFHDLPVFLWAIFPPLMVIVLIIVAFLNPQVLLQMMAKDVEGGIVEFATVLILVPGIFAGFSSFFYHRKRLPDRWLGWWILMWTLACVYFAGEEISWGQWIFDWKTPEMLKRLNIQQETNLHNITPWLYQKPQALVEIWIFTAGFVLPIWWRIKKTAVSRNPDSWRFWLFPTYVCIPAAALTAFVRLFKPIVESSPRPHLERLGSGELREYYIAVFLCIYMLSFWFRSRQRADRQDA
jgi:hypothetical protein